MTDPELMGRVQLEWRYWQRFLLPGDHEGGLPEAWELLVDFENHTDAAWFGCPVHYHHGQVPDTEPILAGDRARLLFDQGIPDPFAPEWARRACDILAHWQARSERGWTFLGRPVRPARHAPFLGNDGVFTCAASLRGATQICLDIYESPEYVRELLAYIHEAFVQRMEAWRRHLDLPVAPSDGFWGADDSIALLSPEVYREFVLPWHRRFYDRFATARGRGMHLCGSVQHLLPLIARQLGIEWFDTGFPVDFGRLRRELGPEITVSGGPHAALFTRGNTPETMAERTREILTSGILQGGRFVLQEGNNLPPTADLEVCRAFCAAGMEYGAVVR
jgi:hypothetical protein